MSTPDDAEGIRGTELAEDASGHTIVPPNSDPFGADGVRGDGLATGAAPQGDAPDPGEEAEDGLRGDGLAEGA